MITAKKIKGGYTVLRMRSQLFAACFCMFSHNRED